MATPVVVVGHRNPDNDTICAAIGYAHLKNELEERAQKANPEHKKTCYEAVRLGPLPPESTWILEKAGLQKPRVISHVHSRVKDVMTPNPISINRDATLLEAGRLLRQHNVRALVVTRDDGTYYGLITTRMIAERYVAATDVLAEDGSNNMAVAADLIASLEQKVADLTDTDVLILDEEGFLKEAIEDLMASVLREAVVLDDDHRCVGIVTRSDIATQPKRKVILVDHNETRQAVQGIEEAQVMEVVDHHRIGDVSTAAPIQFLNLPVGSTATIVALEFDRYGVEITKPYALILLSAIMTDTVVLKSPTTTPIDFEQADKLAEIAGVEVTEFGLDVFKCRGGDKDLSIENMVGSDSKEFQLGDSTVLIAQHETVDLSTVMTREEEIRNYMRRLKDEKGYEFVLFMITDIMAEGSQFICEGNRRIIDRVFNINCEGKGGTWMPGILSRKKQVAARLLGD